MADQVEESIDVGATADEAFGAVTDVRRMARWSPECVAVWIWRRSGGYPKRFVGWNRRGFYLWFTTCAVVVVRPAEEFAFDVTTFGLPVARWGYRFAPISTGVTVTEYWNDRRTGGARLLGRLFTGSGRYDRAAVNRDGMRRTLARLKSELEHRTGS
jgi:hypothetical protein